MNFADNLTHPWFEGVRSEFKSLCKSPNRLLLCILCIILLNIDESIYFEYFGLGSYYKHDHNDHHKLHDITLVDSNKIALYNAYELIIEDTDKSSSNKNKQCHKIRMDNYLGSNTKNVFHTQLMIGVMFGFVMHCRLPILFTFINIMIRSGFSFKPKMIPMFIDKKELRPRTFYGSSFKLLNDEDKISYNFMNHNLNYYDDSSSDDDEEEDIGLDYDLMNNEPARQLFSDQ